VSYFGQPNTPDPQSILRRMAELREKLSSQDPGTLAAHSGARLEIGADREASVVFNLLGEELQLRLPNFEIHSASRQPLAETLKLLALYYFAWADGTPLSGRWISFAELPDGRFYHPAFQSYTGVELGRVFGNDLPALERAASRLHGMPHPLGDRAYIFNVLPRLPLLLVCWTGDEDFPATCQLLFDASVPHYLPTDGCAITGSLLTRRLLRAARDLG
jgi:Domain of unknown function (DUF3786)